MAQRVTIRSESKSERLYDEVIIESRPPGRTNRATSIIRVDAETGLMVWDVAKFEAWIGGEAHGSDS